MLNEETKRELNYIAIRKMIEPAEITYWKQKQKTVLKQLSAFIHSVLARVSSPNLAQPAMNRYTYADWYVSTGAMFDGSNTPQLENGRLGKCRFCV